MKTLILLFFLFFFAAAAEAKPLLVRWSPYVQGSTPAERLVLWRGTNGGTLQPYTAITDMLATSYSDNNVRWNKDYCYTLRAVTADDIPSVPSPRVCARPLR